MATGVKHIEVSVITRPDGSIPGLKKERVYEFDILIRKVREISSDL